MSSNFGGTLTGGIQDISALLPLIGTEQSESHIGSALEGGFLYAAATPLSLFGSLGIAKAGISILVASIAIPKPSFSLRWPIVSFKRSGKLFCGARVLSNAGFELVGNVAPLIGMDGECYKAETRLQQILEEKHINDPGSVAIEWKSRKWNFSLVLWTMAAAAVAFVPYIQLTVTNPPDSPHLPWGFPLLRIFGSCIAAVCCQFLLQSRTISLMKSRILFMTIQGLLIEDLKRKNAEFVQLSMDHLEEAEDDDPEFSRLFVIYMRTRGYADAILVNDLADLLSDKMKTEVEKRWSDTCLSLVFRVLEGSFQDSDFIRLFSKYAKWRIFQHADFIQFLKDELPGKAQPPESILECQDSFQWDSNLPAEESLWSLEQYLLNSSAALTSRQSSHQLSGRDPQSHVSIPMATPSQFLVPALILSTLRQRQNEHFPSPVRDRFFVIISWVLLLLSLPAALAGYIGCFTLVSNSSQNGPLIWLGLEAALSVLRIFLWAYNPTFDEATEVTVRLKLSPPKLLVTTEKDVVGLFSYDDVLWEQWKLSNVSMSERNGPQIHPILPLLSEARFLQRITPYTGPLEQFGSPENMVIYFTLSGDRKNDRMHLFMVVFDVSKRTAFTLYQLEGQDSDSIQYFDTSLRSDNDTDEMEAILQSQIDARHPRRSNYAAFYVGLSGYYHSILQALSGAHRQPLPAHTNASTVTVDQNTAAVARRSWTWSLSSKRTASDETGGNMMGSLSLSKQDQLYFQWGYEHHLKTKLMNNWGTWIVDAIGVMKMNARNECLHALVDASSEKGRWEHTEVDVEAVWEWTRRELALLRVSIELEKILYSRMKYIDSVMEANQREKDWVHSEWITVQRKRLNREKELAKKRMEKARNNAAEQAKNEGRQFTDDDDKTLHPNNVWKRWEWGTELINKEWVTVVEQGVAKWDEHTAIADLDRLEEWSLQMEDDRLTFVQQLEPIFHRWSSQRDNERQAMDETIERIEKAESTQLDEAYDYPTSGWLAAPTYSRFADIGSLTWSGQDGFAAKYSCGAVFDLRYCNIDVIREVASKVSTRTMINVPEDLIHSIPPNDHLLYASSDSPEGEEIPLEFILQNRERWWTEQTANASTFYLCPQQITDQYGLRRQHGTIARVMLFIQAPTRLRLRLLHFRSGFQASVSILEKETKLLNITDAIPEELGLQDFELEQSECGKHELEVVASNGEGLYCFSNIIIDFL